METEVGEVKLPPRKWPVVLGRHVPAVNVTRPVKVREGEQGSLPAVSIDRNA